MEHNILPVLKYSYDSLADEHIKSCFLYCALFPEDGTIDKERLIDYWICEGFIEEYQVRKKAMNKGYGVLGTLIRANLLTEVMTYDVCVSSEAVVMHDVVREMALWIASCFGKQKETFVVQARVGLLKMPKVKDWGAVRRISLMDNKIEEITCGSRCFELTTLFLQKNNLGYLSGKLIWHMQKLVVLDLSRNSRFNELPEEISKLTSLQYLDLSNTWIKRLPVGFQELKKLTHLNMTSTERLCSMGGISKLTSLRILKLLESNVHGDVSLWKELQLLEHLQVLTITISMESGLEEILSYPRLASCIDSLDIYGFQQKRFSISSLMRMQNIRELYVNIRELCVDYRESPCFTNLSHVRISECNNKDLTWLLFAPNLVILHIEISEVEEIINKEKATNLTGIITPFRRLKGLLLTSLRKLESIYWSPLLFPLLGYIIANNCPKLRKFPLNATSVPRLGEFWIEMRPEEQVTNLEWENEDAKNRFLPLINKV